MPMRAGPKGQVSAPPLNLRRLPLRLEQHWDLLPGLAAELAEDRGRIQWLRRGRLLLVVDLQVRLFVPDGIDVGVVGGLLGSFHRPPPITRGPHAYEGILGRDWQVNPQLADHLAGGWPTPWRPRRAGRPPGWPLGPATWNLRGGRVGNRGGQQAGVGCDQDL